MKESHIERIPYENLKNATHIEVEVHYSLGGLNFSGGSSARGYYLSVKPVTVRGNTVSYNLFSGVSRLLLVVNRYSDRQFKQAVELSEAVKDELVRQVLAKHKITEGKGENSDAA